MGYVKRETPAAPRLHAKKREEERLAEKRTPLPKPPPIKTEKEKEELRKKMKDKVKQTEKQQHLGWRTQSRLGQKAVCMRYPSKTETG